jgi:hypothetical protein
MRERVWSALGKHTKQHGARSHDHIRDAHFGQGKYLVKDQRGRLIVEAGIREEHMHQHQHHQAHHNNQSNAAQQSAISSVLGSRSFSSSAVRCILLGVLLLL